MFNTGCRCKGDCIGISLVASVIVGIITAFLSFSASITVTSAFLWVVLGIAVVYLAITLVITALSKNLCFKSCIYSTLSVQLIGILGAILTSVVLLAINFAAASVLGAIFRGATVGFLALALTETACLVKCFASCDE
ncbi:MAG: hypothetical protein Q4B31_00045 [Clostridia bacterium]|nr:hypothetical protein [Clostridia bacterium]